MLVKSNLEEEIKQAKQKLIELLQEDNENLIVKYTKQTKIISDLEEMIK